MPNKRICEEESPMNKLQNSLLNTSDLFSPNKMSSKSPRRMLLTKRAYEKRPFSRTMSNSAITTGSATGMDG